MQYAPSDHCYLQSKPLFYAVVVLLNIWASIKNYIPLEIMECVRINVIKHSQPEGVKLKVREHKLRSILHWQGGALKQKA